MLKTMQHLKTCGDTVGAFLLVKICSIITLRETRWCYWGSLYLDEHGEEDINLQRGKRLLLAANRKADLTRALFGMQLDHDTRVLSNSGRADGN